MGKTKGTAMCDSNEIVIIQRKGGKVLLHAGFQYYRHQTYKKDNSSIWRCSMFKKVPEKCPGSITIFEDKSLSKSKPHTCTPDFIKNEIALKVDDMKKEAVNTDKPIPKIYNENISQMKNNGYDLITKLPTFHNIYHGLYDARNKFLNVKKTVFKNVEEVEVPNKFFNIVLADYYDDRERILIFCSEQSTKLICNIKEFFMDGTFKSCPAPFTRLYCIHGEFNSSTITTHVIPLIYILMCNKKEQSYNIVFQILNSRLPQFNPVKVHCDMELAAINALLSIFPKVDIVLCYYHWTKNIWKHAKSHKHTNSKAERRIVALCASLPLLPPSRLLEGWEYIKVECRAVYKMAKYLAYIQKFWLNKHSDKISVFGERHRTNNPVEGWHAGLNRDINKNNVTLLRLLNVIEKFENVNKEMKLNKRKKGNILNDEYITFVQMELINGEIEVGHALEKLRV